MTEDEAKTKWCPFARAALTLSDGTIVPGASVVNRRATGHADAASLCIGSACMAWRWHWSPEKIAGAVEGSLLATREPDGFCGLAGKP